MKHVLITGGAGFIGSHTADLLLDAGYHVRVMDNLKPPVHRPGLLPDFFPKGAEFMYGDVRNKADWIAALDGIDAVIHLAAYQDYLPDFSTFFHVNNVGTALLYEVIVEKKLTIEKVVVAASQAAYGEGKYWSDAHQAYEYPDPRPMAQLQQQDWECKSPVDGSPLTLVETDEARTTPHNAYAISKITEERIALVLGHRYGIPSASMRYSIVQGARQSFRNAYSGVLRIFAMQVLAGERPTVYEDGEQVRDYVYVGDVARANKLVLEDERANYQAFNVGGGKRVTVNEFGRAMAKVAGRPDIEPLVTGEFRVGDTRHVISDISKLQALGWEPTGNVENNAAEYIDWATRQPDFGNYTRAARAHMQQVGALGRGSGSE